ncbi:MAG: hypothetical protein ACYCS8_17755 [Acidithiobacillus sp.]|uniref:hypothetical protein n=1 Tax=Acidithiobacillus thiooxidans TaxID=930 RepID=UPI0009DA2AD8|nr:hypothetical protein [Acidithiobacillus thiooxidans]
MKTAKTVEQLAVEVENIEFELANELSPSSHVTSNGDVIHIPVPDQTPEIKRLRGIQAQITREKLMLKKALSNNNVIRIMPGQHCARRTQKRRGADGKRQATAGDSNDSDPEPPRPGGLADAAALANQFCVSKKTIQNIYSRTPHLLPKAISIPGARGPRWTQAAIDEWLQNRPKHTPKPVVAAPRRKVGRPRIAALRSNGGAPC